MSKLFIGAGVALVTPFTKNYEVDFNALETVVCNQVKGGMDYLVALGTTAETSVLCEEEKSDIVKLIKEKSSGLPVVVGMGGNDTRKMLREIDKFDFSGVSGILVVTPYYNKPSQEGMYLHYTTISKASPVPVILYNVPSRTGVNIDAKTVSRLAWENKNIVAIKDASGNLSQGTKISKNTPEYFSLISGDDFMALPIISIGGQGIISVIANALPEKLSSLADLALKNKLAEALVLHNEMFDLFGLLFKEGNPGGIKALLHCMGIIENQFRLPLCPISDNTYNEIKEAYLKLK
ncbi:MAG: 4-hydroxy-tetrahydrodipicolinate synthase [Bacteroidales bacterium]|jgi:4-hydroxy-tetrahydrodipicolinate synthase|nr:4-hydroxy-tetrahydrodipicolinate synthase [Bacteroidales bacterium]